MSWPFQSSGQTLPSGPPGRANSFTRLVQCSLQSPTSVALFALSGRTRTAGVRQPVEDGAVANQQQHTIRVAVATGKSSHQVWWSRYQEGILVRTARLLASTASTFLLQEEILGGPQPLPDDLVECLTSRWVASHGPVTLPVYVVHQR